MSAIRRICGKLNIVCYLLLLFQVWHLCQYGGRRLSEIIIGAIGAALICSIIIWSVLTACLKKNGSLTQERGFSFWISLLIILIGSGCAAGGVIYSAIPGHGRLAEKLQEKQTVQYVSYDHNNFFNDGVQGLLDDIGKKVDLPKELYVSGDGVKIIFNERGRVQKVDTFLYGKDKNDRDRTFLISYDASRSDTIRVDLDGYTSGSYDSDCLLQPMIRILSFADYQKYVSRWQTAINATSGETVTYGVLYYGVRSFTNSDGLEYLPGDVDGDGVVSGETDFSALDAGGEMTGYEVSLYIPGMEDTITPVRYMMEPQYTPLSELSEEHEAEQSLEAQLSNGWHVDQNNGSVEFYVEKNLGWRLEIVDAAAGSRFYDLNQTTDGGKTWTTINQDPFDGTMGVAEGLEFFDGQFGFAGLAGASGEHSQIYVTYDGGATFEPVTLPLDSVTELSPYAAELHFSASDYQYMMMPEKDGDTYKIKLIHQDGEQEGICFTTADQGKTWTFAGAFSDYDNDGE